MASNHLDRRTMAQAVQGISGTQVTFGPAGGFYYDFARQRSQRMIS